MRINDIISSKGSSVITARSTESDAHLVSLLNDNRIGAVVITDDEQAVIGVAAERMTEHRTRHMPVLREGQMVAIVSIGDIVKSRIDQLQSEREHLENYLRG